MSGEAMWAGRCTGDGGREDGRSLSGAAGKRDDRSRQVRRGALRGEGWVLMLRLSGWTGRHRGAGRCVWVLLRDRALRMWKRQ